MCRLTWHRAPLCFPDKLLWLEVYGIRWLAFSWMKGGCGILPAIVLFLVRSGWPPLPSCEEPLASEGQEWLAGVPLTECPNMLVFIARLRFAWTAERKVEGQHRNIKLRGRASPNHSVAYMSYGLRRQEICDRFQQDCDWANYLAKLAASTSSRIKAMRALGLDNHPTKDMKQRQHIPLGQGDYVKMIYHADHESLYGPCPLTALTRRQRMPVVPRAEVDWAKTLLIEHIRVCIQEVSECQEIYLFARILPSGLECLKAALSHQHNHAQSKVSGHPHDEVCADLLASSMAAKPPAPNLHQPLESVADFIHQNCDRHGIFMKPCLLNVAEFKRPFVKGSAHIRAHDLVVEVMKMGNSLII